MDVRPSVGVNEPEQALAQMDELCPSRIRSQERGRQTVHITPKTLSAVAEGAESHRTGLRFRVGALPVWTAGRGTVERIRPVRASSSLATLTIIRFAVIPV